MRLDLTRAQRRFLGLVGEPTPRTGADLEAFTHVGLSPQAEETLERLLETPGRFQGGPLFCTVRSNTHFEVRFAAGNGYWPWPSISDPLLSDERYLLGWSDALTTLYGPRCEWRGNWLMYPNRQMSRLDDDLIWVERARTQSLIDREHFLMVVGWQDHHLTFRSYLYDHDNQWPHILKSESWIGSSLG